jgi:DNA invertase Pin-like site-specific DNA recombinase
LLRIALWRNKGCFFFILKPLTFISIQDKIDTGTGTGKAMFGMLSVLTEFERDIDIIHERTHGLA